MSRPLLARYSRRTGFAWLAASWIATALSAAVPATRPFDIPAGPAETTLRQFSDQAGGQFLFSTGKVAGVRTNALTGEFTARDALERLVAGTALRAVQDEGTGALTVDRAAMPAASGRGIGAIEGRVFNQETGSYVNNARVVVEALRLETFTDEYGQYSFPRVPAGEAVVRVLYTGFSPLTRVVAVRAGERAEGNVSLGSGAAMGDEKTIVLDAFKVATTRDMAASDIAVNEQRYASEIKNVVATDSFGDIAEGNVGEFAKFLPGVTLNRDGSDGRSISLGGVPPGSTPIMLDGNSLASAASSGGGRQVEFEQISITSMARVEVTRSQNPDTPANAIGGTVNLISKSAFERARPIYSVKTYLSFKGGDFELKKVPSPFAKKEYPFEPNVELSAVVPVSRNFGFTFSGLVTRALANGQGATMDWVPTIAGQSANFPATTPDRPYLVRHRLQERPKISTRQSVSAGADWRISGRDVLTFGFQYAYFKAEFWVRQVNFDVGRVESFGPDFTQGAPGTGFAQTVYDARQKDGTTYMPSLRWKHNGPVWQLQVNSAFSRASNHYRNFDKGYFQTNNAYFRNLTIRFEDMNFDHPGVISVKNAAGADVDAYQIENYSLETVQGTKIDGYDIVRSLSANGRREIDLVLPLVLKTGFDLRSQRRDLGTSTYDATHLGADGLIRTTDDNAAQWFDPIYSQRELLFGKKMEWMNLAAIGDSFRANPGHFVQTETNRMNYYRSLVNGSRVITETVTAPYLRLDTKLFNGRLQLTGGVRYEHTEDVGDGALVDPTRIYRRDASGAIVRDAAGRPVAIAPLNSVAGSELAYVLRGAHTDKSYDGFFPSFNGAVLIRPNLIARFSYARSISRPEFTHILPAMNLPDTESTSRRLTLSNPALKPWFADSFGVALEYYFNEPSTGVLSTRLYRRDITDFWGTRIVPATDDVLEPWGLDPEIYGAALGYDVSTRMNVGAARVSGAEFDYRQNLVFLPHWARGLTVFGNITLQHLAGSEMASFSGFVGKTINYGLTFSRARFTVRAAVNLKGRVKQGQITNAGTEPGTFTYLLPRRSADLTAEYRLTRQFSVFVSGRNVNEAIDDTVTYGPSTPSDRILRGRADYRSYWNVGVKGTF
ncbi:MAG: TonB-dependent receptor [Opitutaceae bacterium]|nr:TonB-dependent receptor [Opitutaceae bacterium]